MLTSPNGFVYPIVNAVPRLLPESFLEHEGFLEQYYDGFKDRKKMILQQFGVGLKSDYQKNKGTKKSFTTEWELLKNKAHVPVWNQDATTFKRQLENELQLGEDFLKDMAVVDIGTGHGRSAQLMAASARFVIAMDLGNSVEPAAAANNFANCHYIQADLQRPPFEHSYFDLVYSSGVLHHTSNTRLAFDRVGQLVIKNGLLCVWLYQPFDNGIHRFMLWLRNYTTRLPIRLQWWLYAIFLLPIHQIISYARGNKRHWRETMINLMDMLSPPFRSEQLPATVAAWFRANAFVDISQTTNNQFGFSMKGRKQL